MSVSSWSAVSALSSMSSMSSYSVVSSSSSSSAASASGYDYSFYAQSSMTSEQEDQEQEDELIQNLVRTCAFALLVSCFSFSVMNYFLPKTYRLWNIPVFLAGIGMALTSLKIISMAMNLDPEIIVLVFLPPILFVAGLEANWHVFKRLFFQSILLAGPAVLISAGVIGVVAKYVNSIKGYVWNWPEALLLGAALSATDPVATIATVKKLGASPKLSVLIEGEALLNDGTAYVLFFVIEGVLLDGSFSFGQTIWSFLTGGGPAFGIIMAAAAYYWLRTIHEKPVLEITVLVVAVFSTMFLSEMMTTSGVLAVVSFGLFFAYRGKFGLSPSAYEPNLVFWEQMEFIINSLIFFFSGSIVYNALSASSAWDWFNMFMTFLALNVSRAIALLVCWPILAFTGYGFDKKKYVMMWSAGLRGGVSLSLALFVSANANYLPVFRREFVTQVVGSVLLTSLINGVLAKPIYTWLKFPTFRPKTVILFAHALGELEHDTTAVVDALKTDPSLEKVDWDLVMTAVPKVTSDDNEIVMELANWIPMWKHVLLRDAQEAIVEEPLPETEFSEGEINENTIQARELLMRLLHADIQEQHRTASRLSPSTIIELSEGVADAGDDPATIFAKLNELMRKLFHPRLPIPAILNRIAGVRWLYLYLLFTRVRETITQAQSLMKGIFAAAEEVEADTGMHFKEQLDHLKNHALRELRLIYAQHKVQYSIAINTLAVGLILQFRKTKLDKLLAAGFIDEKTRDVIVKADCHSPILVWKFHDVLLPNNAAVMFERLLNDVQANPVVHVVIARSQQVIHQTKDLIDFSQQTIVEQSQHALNFTVNLTQTVLEAAHIPVPHFPGASNLADGESGDAEAPKDGETHTNPVSTETENGDIELENPAAPAPVPSGSETAPPHSQPPTDSNTQNM